MKAAGAGIAYGLILFGLGFLLAMVRIPILVPRFGETAAVLIELPVMLAAAWAVAGALVRRKPLSSAGAWLMGATGLCVLLGAEVALGVASGSTLPDILASWLTIPGNLGLAAQIAAAAFPRLGMGR